MHPRRSHVLFLSLLASAAAIACGGGSTPAGPGEAPPTGLTYAVNPVTYTVGVAITLNRPSVGGGTVTGYTVSPALPAGLSLDGVTGAITGTPTAAASAADHQITATGPGGHTTAVVRIAVLQSGVAPPANLAYPAPPTFLRFAAISPLSPTSSGGAVDSYAAAGLPAGLGLDAASGIISGTPTGAAGTATVSVTATNGGGHATASLSLVVADGNPTLALSTGLPDAAGQAALVSEQNKTRRGSLNPAPDPVLPLLVWDPLLAQVANAWAQRCQSAGSILLDHNAGRTSDYAALGGSGSVGENIYASTGTVTVGGAVGLWSNEKADYQYATNTCASGATCGHYTQLVWRSTLRVGCAVSRCAALHYPNTIVCDYAPAGNYVGQKPY